MKDFLTHGGGGVCLVIDIKTVSPFHAALPDIFICLKVLALDIFNSSPHTRVVTCYPLPPSESSSGLHNATYVVP